MDKDYADETAIYVQLSIHPLGAVITHMVENKSIRLFKVVMLR